MHLPPSKGLPEAGCSTGGVTLFDLSNIFDGKNFSKEWEPWFISMGKLDLGLVKRGVQGGCSFFIPGLGQFLQGRFFTASFQYVTAAILWIVYLGFVVHLWSAYDAATHVRSKI